MKKSKLLLPLLIVGGYAAYIFLRNKKAAGENLRFEPVDIQIDSERSRRTLWTRLYYKVKINLVNPEQAAVNVRNVMLNATANGGPLGTLTSTQPFSVPAKGNQIIQLDTSFSIFGAASIIINIVRNREPLTVNITGYVDTDLGRVNIQFSKEVKIL
jgi:LEA14-like dessication related protein